MAEASLLWETNNTGDGVSSGYTDDQMFQLFRCFCPPTNLGGVAPDILNELAVSGTATPVAVASGQALVYGIPYYNTASVNVAVATPAASTRVDYIVLRASWAAQTVRITRVAGTEGAGAPSLTQSAGTTWDIPLATVSITTGGVITVTDAREFLGLLVNYAVNPRSHISGQNGIVVDPANGNSRGNDAVDLQTLRTGATEVASGSASVIGGGDSNKATGVGSVVAGGVANEVSGVEAVIGGGIGNVASGQTSVIAGGQFNQATQTDAVVAGGTTNTASGSAAAVGGGELNTASGSHSAVSGGLYGSASKYGQEAHASGRFAANGDAQRSIYTLRRSTSNNTPSELFLDGSSSRLTIPSDSTYAFRILLVARRSDADNESAAYEFVGCIDNNAGTTALVGSVTKTVVAEDTAGWDADVTADNTNDALVIKVTGENAKTIRWVATVWTTEVTG